MIRVGYQGIVGSYSYEAAKILLDKLNIKTAKLIPLVTSAKVVEYLFCDKIDYAVLAIRNSTAGEVYETRQALLDKKLNLIEQFDLKVEHCLYTKNNVSKDCLKRVVSHEQALSQTKKTRQQYFNYLDEFPYEDTALAAKDLSNNLLDLYDAVICSKSAGKYYNLQLLYEGLNDKLDNYTTFGIFKKY